MKKMMMVLLPSVLLLSSCAPVDNEMVGTVAGGVAGGLLGSTIGGGAGKVAAIAGGTVLGAFLGGKIGQYMDRQDKILMQQALETAPVGKTVSWKNPDNGNQYSVRPTKTYYRQDEPCREYTTHAIIGGKSQEIYGTACRKADGAWQVVH